ncbi:hypothetical protein RND81_10G070900 [Saponaria officinalis]|uniref:Uncharacterized protein n=1 Tax=Saponaria officinalis TaxID=3572 RepID=A0AAW1HYX5_SAPOF
MVSASLRSFIWNTEVKTIHYITLIIQSHSQSLDLSLPAPTATPTPALTAIDRHSNLPLIATPTFLMPTLTTSKDGAELNHNRKTLILIMKTLPSLMNNTTNNNLSSVTTNFLSTL